MQTLKHLLVALRMTIVTTILFGLIYPAVVTIAAQRLFPSQANGSLITRDGRIIGSTLIGQSFNAPGYFHGRPSAAGTGYDASASGGSNLGPTSRTLIDTVTTRVAAERAQRHDDVPVDLVTSSASGLDPDITIAAALFQVDRVAAARQVSADDIRALIRTSITERQWGFFGERRVNVLQINLRLDARWPQSATSR